MLKLRQYRDINENEQLVIGCDPGTGEKNYSCAQFFSRTNLDVPIVWHSSEMAVTMTNELCPILNKIMDITGIKPVIAYERGNGGSFELERLAGMNFDSKYEIFKMKRMGLDNGGDDTHRLGWDTNGATRPKMLAELKTAIDNKLFRVYDKPTIEEMFSFVITQSSNSYKAKAEKGALDDSVMALAIAWQLHQLVPLQEREVYVAPRRGGGYGGTV